MRFTAFTMAGAAERNKLTEVQYLHSQGCFWSWQLLEKAASKGFCELVRWCYERGCPWRATVGTAVRRVAQGGSVELRA
jgi:hypothetical protein